MGSVHGVLSRLLKASQMLRGGQYRAPLSDFGEYDYAEGEPKKGIIELILRIFSTGANARRPQVSPSTYPCGVRILTDACFFSQPR
jgi:hypothetical protein